MDYSNNKGDKRALKVLIYTSIFIFVLWCIKIIELIFGVEFYQAGIYPRKLNGILGIITSPLLHSDFSHLISNTGTLFVLMFTLFYSYKKSALYVTIIIWVITGLSVWIFGRQAYHIGSSGILYGYLSYLFFLGIFRKEPKAIAISLLITFLYGGLVWGILPTKPEISFESHLAGFFSGLFCAIIFRNFDDYERKYEWEEEDDYDEESSEEEAEDNNIDNDFNDFSKN
ncbi:MAG: rhomboid family intramembrane serine protease [Ignavibacteria bacterium]|nr:rhomboid family intramembrane serine protease [Ignavibacteria bacterium]